MASVEKFRQIALSFPETSEQPHFEKISFRIKKKIFATLTIDNNQAVLKLSAVDQSVYCAIDTTIIHPVTGTWGKQGWTVIHLKQIKIDLLKGALTSAYCEVAPKKLGAVFRKV